MQSKVKLYYNLDCGCSRKTVTQYLMNHMKVVVNRRDNMHVHNKKCHQKAKCPLELYNTYCFMD